MAKIPIQAAKRLADEHGLDQVIVVAWGDGQTHVATYGKTLEECDQAAQGGDFVKKALGWPESLKAMPSRVKSLQRQVKVLRERVKELEQELGQ